MQINNLNLSLIFYGNEIQREVKSLMQDGLPGSAEESRKHAIPPH